jgi:hypothetical protein
MGSWSPSRRSSSPGGESARPKAAPHSIPVDISAPSGSLAKFARTEPDAGRVFSHYVTLLERHPERLELEQSHLFDAMEHASREHDMQAILRVQALARRLSSP